MNTLDKELVIDTKIRPVRNVSNDILNAMILALVLLLEPTHAAPTKGKHGNRHGITQVLIIDLTWLDTCRYLRRRL